MAIHFPTRHAFIWKFRTQRGIPLLIVPAHILSRHILKAILWSEYCWIMIRPKCIAKLIANDSNLKGNLTAGLLVGQDPGGKGQMMTIMIISAIVVMHKDTIRTSPPDILLTNYKMLDCLLTRPLDFQLWKDNAPDSLAEFVT